MQGTIQEYTLDMADGTAQKPLIVKQGDTNSRQARFKLIAFKEPWTIPFGCQIHINVHKNDGTYANATCTQEDEYTVLAPITEQMTAVPGTQLGELFFLGSDGDIRSQTFPLVVWDTVTDLDSLISSNDYQALKDSLRQVVISTEAAAIATQYATEQGNAARDSAQRAESAADSLQVAVDAAEAAKVSETNAKASETAAAQTQQEVTDYVESQKAAFVGYSKRETDSQYANAIIKTATGAGRVDVDDAWTAPVIGLDVAGRSEQVQTTGKNLFGGDALVEKLKAEAGATVDGVNGTVTFLAPNANNKVIYSNFEAGKEYTIILYGRNTNTSVPLSHTNIQVGYDDGTYVSMGFEKAGEDSYCVFHTAQGKNATRISGGYNSVGTLLYYDKCGIFEGNIDLSAFEPYTGAAASPSPAYPQQIVSTGTVGTGAQLLPQTANETGTTVGVKWRMENGYIVLNGVSSGETSASTDIKIVGSNDTYVDANFPPGLIQMRAQEMPPNATLFVSQKISDGTMLLWHTDSDVSTNAFTHSVGDTYRIFLRITRAGASFNNAKVIVMFNVGPYAKLWEPYTGGKPAPSEEYPQEMTVRATGAQLLNLPDKTGTLNGIKYAFKGGEVTANGTPVKKYTVIYQKNITLSPGNYYISGGNTSTGKMYAQILIVKDGVQNYYVNKAFTVVGDETEIIVSLLNGDHTEPISQIFKPMLNAGDKPLPYEPYRTAAATITLTEPLRGIGECRDRLGYRDGVWGIEGRAYEAVYDGSEDEAWYIQSVNDNGISNYMIALRFLSIGTSEISLCNRLIYDKAPIANVTRDGFLLAATSTLYVRLKEVKTVADLRAWLADEPLIVVYPRATPTWTPLPDSAQQALNALTTYAGTTHLTITTGGTTPDVTLDYVQDTHKALEECQETAKDYTNNQIAEILALLPTATQAAIIDNGASTLLAESEV